MTLMAPIWATGQLFFLLSFSTYYEKSEKAVDVLFAGFHCWCNGVGYGDATGVSLLLAGLDRIVTRLDIV
jgi:hypothetical protein